jgi:putative transcriptional regulator
MSESLRGQFLIAGRAMRDPNFYQTVVLIVGHGADGAMGVVINRPSGLTVSQALKKHFDLPETGEMVYDGGPVERNALFVLHNAADLEGEEDPVVEGLHVGNSPEMFEKIVNRVSEQDPELRYRIYFGCAGWAPDQLESELNRNDWHILPASADYVFHEEPYAVWEQALTEYRRTHPLVRGAQGKPDLN